MARPVRNSALNPRVTSRNIGGLNQIRGYRGEFRLVSARIRVKRESRSPLEAPRGISPGEHHDLPPNFLWVGGWWGAGKLPELTPNFLGGTRPITRANAKCAGIGPGAGNPQWMFAQFSKFGASRASSALSVPGVLGGLLLLLRH